MLNMFEVIETNNMIEHEKLDVRTITMGISLLDCCDDDLQALNEKIYKKHILYAFQFQDFPYAMYISLSNFFAIHLLYADPFLCFSHIAFVIPRDP